MKRFKPKLSRPLSRWPTPKETKRFLSKVKIGDIPPGQDEPCWIWDAYTDRKGYGQFHFAGQIEWAHRFSVQALKHIKLPEGMEAHHNCLNASCVNPEHISPSTKLDNVAEANNRRKSVKAVVDDIPF